MAKAGTEARRGGNVKLDDSDLAAFDYGRSAELFPTRNRATRRHPVGYKRFDRAADAIRFAIEELPPELLAGAYLEVEEERFDGPAIRQLYDSQRYPLHRRAADKSKPE